MSDTADTPAVQVVFLTGQSDAPRCALSPVQHAFLDALPALRAFGPKAIRFSVRLYELARDK